MKKLMSIFLFIFLAVLISYYFLFIKSKRAVNGTFLEVVYTSQRLQINSTESSKYIKGYSVKDINDTTVQIDIFTTTIYNPFARRRPQVNINLSKKIKIVKIAGREIQKKNNGNASD